MQLNANRTDRVRLIWLERKYRWITPLGDETQRQPENVDIDGQARMSADGFLLSIVGSFGGGACGRVSGDGIRGIHVGTRIHGHAKAID